MREAFRVIPTAAVERTGRSEVFRFSGHREQIRLWPDSAAGELQTTVEVDRGDYEVTRDRVKPVVGKFAPGRFDIRKLAHDDPQGQLRTVDGNPVGRNVAKGILALNPAHALKRALRKDTPTAKHGIS